jgi:hypothetical protein
MLLYYISGISAINPLVAFYDIHGGKREVLFFYFVPDTTRDKKTDKIRNEYITESLNVAPITVQFKGNRLYSYM